MAELTAALNVEGTKAEAAELLRSLLSGVRLIPEGAGLAIELTGELAGIMALGVPTNDRTPARCGDSVGRSTVVAGAGFGHWLQLNRAERSLQTPITCALDYAAVQ